MDSADDISPQTPMFKTDTEAKPTEMENLKFGLPIRLFSTMRKGKHSRTLTLFSQGLGTKSIGWRSIGNTNKDLEIFRIIPAMNSLHTTNIYKYNKKIAANIADLDETDQLGIAQANDGFKEEMQANYTIYLEQKGIYRGLYIYI